MTKFPRPVSSGGAASQEEMWAKKFGEGKHFVRIFKSGTGHEAQDKVDASLLDLQQGDGVITPPDYKVEAVGWEDPNSKDLAGRCKDADGRTIVPSNLMLLSCPIEDYYEYQKRKTKTSDDHYSQTAVNITEIEQQMFPPKT